jgi:hypothetical protein
MIKITDLLKEQEAFTATSKKSGQTAVFKSKDARDAAVKSGTHSKIDDKDDGDGKKDTPKVNIFDKPKKDEPKSEPSKPKLESDPQAEKVAAEISKKYGITPEKMGEEDFKVAMGRAVYSALTNSNFHSEARELIAVLEDKPELSKRPDYPSIDDDDYQEKMDAIRQKYASTYTERDDYSSALGRETSDAAKWDGVKSVGTLTKQLRDNGMNEFADKIESIFDKKENNSTKLRDLLPESIINEGTRSQVGIIGSNGKIVSAYVHYDGYPSNMKPGLKHHMKSDKDVLKLIKMGGARGIFNDKDIEYYKSGTPLKGDSKNIESYIKDADMKNGAEFVYLYNVKDKKWYYADTYKDTELKKLF